MLCVCMCVYVCVCVCDYIINTSIYVCIGMLRVSISLSVLFM